MRVVVTGGAGFIGSAFINHLLDNIECEVLCVDKLTYAGRRMNIKHNVSFLQKGKYFIRISNETVYFLKN